jgi:cobalt-zinc-cadmium efflux system membrane fusion protein
MKNRIILFIGIILLSACGGQKNQEEIVATPAVVNSVSLTDAQMKSAGVETGKLAMRSISNTLKLNGKIDVPPQNMVSVSMPLGGFLKSTKLLPGMFVKKGEVIATMEDQQYIQMQQEYLTAKSKLVFSENEYNRQKELNQSKASSDKVFQQTEMDYKTQKIVVSALAEKLRLINVNPETLSETTLSRSVNMYSSIEGFVSKVNVNIGKYVNPSDVLFELINPADIHLNLEVFEKDLNKLSIGQKLKAYNNNEPDKKYNCEIILISQDLSSDRSAEVHCHFDTYDKKLLPGMYMNADVEIQNNNVVSINQDAIVTFEGKDYVFIAKGANQFEMVEIQKGINNTDFSEIIFVNKKEYVNEQFVTKGTYSILMQLKNTNEE